ncbi:SCO-spondin-like [Haliotis rubra]|uniref:SCO-spondin-like n=1 Tax=Haliotis rubra TaxID=36100 RepID=UPI001EE61975|nr:SCO-spondin-like [Haliotis rubra]
MNDYGGISYCGEETTGTCTRESITDATVETVGDRFLISIITKENEIVGDLKFGLASGTAQLFSDLQRTPEGGLNQAVNGKNIFEVTEEMRNGFSVLAAVFVAGSFNITDTGTCTRESITDATVETVGDRFLISIITKENEIVGDLKFGLASGTAQLFSDLQRTPAVNGKNIFEVTEEMRNGFSVLAAVFVAGSFNITDTGPPTCWEPWGEWSACDTGCKSVTVSRTRNRNCSDDTRCTCTESKVQELACESDCSTHVRDLLWNAIFRCLLEFRDCVIGETCVCEEGYKMEDGKCIPKEECGCYDSEGKKYNENEVYPSPSGSPCEECKCNNEKKFVCGPKAACCDWAEWTSWDDCNPSCGVNATKSRTRVSQSAVTCDKQNPETETADCVVPLCPCDYQGDIIKSGTTVDEECFTVKCEDGNATKVPKSPIDGTYKEWAEWSTITCNGKMCRDRNMTRQRECDGPKCDGKECENGPREVETEPCGTAECCDPVWTAWTSCSKDCIKDGEASGIKTRNFTIANPDDKSCQITEQTQEPCGEPCYCNKYIWSEWTTCEGTCGLQNVTRTRDTQNDVRCEHLDKLETRDCYEEPCICDKANEEYSNYTYCQMTCEDRSPRDNCESPPKPGCMCTNNTMRRGADCVTIEECLDCVYNGKIYKNGESITDPADNCTKFICEEGEPMPTDNCVKSCNSDTEDMILAPEGSCCKYECRKKTCQPSPEKVTIGVQGCVDSFEVEQYSCKGDCGPSTVTFDVTNNNAMVKECRCCIPVETSLKNYTVTCTDSSSRTISIREITSCSCNMCM